MFDAVIVAGGAARRMSGTDKAALLVGGASLLDRVLAATADAAQTVVVGPARPTSRAVIWGREQPPGSGPVAAVAAGLPLTGADVVLLLAADLPWIGPAVPALVAPLADEPSLQCAVLVTDGRRNYLASAWRRTALTTALATVPDVRGAAMRSLYAHVDVVEVLDDADAGSDCDTWADIERARLRARRTEETP